MMKFKLQKKRTINIEILFFPVVVGYFIYIIINEKMYFNIINVFSFCFAVFLVLNGVEDLRKRGINLYNSFLISYFSCLAINNLNISALQKPKNIIDFYFFFFGPILFALILYFGEKFPNVKVGFCRREVNSNWIAIILLIIYISCQLLTIRQTGIALFSDLWNSSDRAHFQISGLSGITYICMWLLLMLLPNVNRIIKIMIALSTVLFLILFIKRGDFICVCVFFLVAWISRYGTRFLTKKNFIRFIVMAVLVLVLFSVWGNYRQHKRGWSEEISIGSALKSNIDSDTINWVYSYTAINFEALKEDRIDKPSQGEFKAVFIPLIRLFEGSQALQEYEEETRVDGVDGFTANSFLGLFIYEAGFFYFFGIIILAIIVVFLDKLCTAVQFQGGRLLLLMCTVITIFDNYYLRTNIFYSLLAGILLFGFITPQYKRKEYV